MLGITVDKNFDKNIIDKNRENDSNNSNRKRSLIIDKMKEKENSDVTATMGTLIFPDKEQRIFRVNLLLLSLAVEVLSS